MKLVIQGKNIEITDSLHEYVRLKVEKAVSHFQALTTEVDVHLSVARNPRMASNQTAEVTIYTNGSVVRAEESSENLYASIDLVADKISRQLRKYKEKRRSHVSVKTAETVTVDPVVSDLIGDRTPALPTEVVRTKYFAMPPMSIQEAQEQLEMVGHDFYMFCNAETGEINVIYERNHGGYGVIQPRNSQHNGHSHSNEKAVHSNSKASHSGTSVHA